MRQTISKRTRLALITIVLICNVGVVQATDIMVLGLFRDMAILRIDGTQHKLRKGEATPQGIKLISATSEVAILEINGKRQKFALGSFTRTTSPPPKTDINEARIWSNRGMFTTIGSINGQPVSFLVDTGATWVAMSTREAKRLGINYRYTGTRTTANTASGTANTWLINLKSVKVGNIELKQVKGAVIEGAGPNTVLLGMSFLGQLKMQNQGQMLLLQK